MTTDTKMYVKSVPEDGLPTDWLLALSGATRACARGTHVHAAQCSAHIPEHIKEADAKQPSHLSGSMSHDSPNRSKTNEWDSSNTREHNDTVMQLSVALQG